jgi:EAL domain-containing protein (putative c-di-GMP-specific phosphodiesterase class I)
MEKTLDLELHIAINITTKQLQAPSFSEFLFNEIKINNLKPEQVTLEITERSLLTHDDNTLSLLKRFRSRGIRLSLAHFGTGYSALSDLKDYPFDVIKLDRSFVSDIPGNSQNSSIVVAMTQIAHSLKMSVVAKGVENLEQYNFLSDNYVNFIQGCYVSKPFPPENFEPWYKALLSENKNG